MAGRAEDTSATRERMRSTLSTLRRHGQIVSLGNGRWQVAETATAKVPEASWSQRALEALKAHPAGLTASRIRALHPEDKAKATALYNAVFQLHHRGRIDRVEIDGRQVYRAKVVAAENAPMPK